MVSAPVLLVFAGASALTVRLVLAIFSRRAKRLALSRMSGPPSTSFATGERSPSITRVLCTNKDAHQGIWRSSTMLKASNFLSTSSESMVQFQNYMGSAG